MGTWLHPGRPLRSLSWAGEGVQAQDKVRAGGIMVSCSILGHQGPATPQASPHHPLPGGVWVPGRGALNRKHSLGEHPLQEAAEGEEAPAWGGEDAGSLLS